jgi:tRNA A37 threonylcarbamoyladenosine modification protein TsaB
VTAAKCLAWALDVPAAGAGALDAMIAASPEGSGPVLAAVAASAEQAFALCRGRGAGEGDLLPAGLYDDTELRRFLEQVGAVAAAEPALAVRLGATVAEGAAEGPDAVTVGRLAMPALRAGGTPVHALVPLYLRRSIPEERLDGRGR